ncbi:MAG: GGDEF domain-containing protein [Ruminococcaceae bacterium]|nr:GGDEF domain-containing protein [Oscillospiraceae bacterium]
MLTTYLMTALINMTALGLLAGLLRNNTSLVQVRRKPFTWGIVLTIGVILAEAGTLVAQAYGPSWRSLNLVCNVLGFMLSPLIPLILIAIFDRRFLRQHIFLLFIAGLNAAAALLSPWLGLIFTVDSTNRYQRGRFFIIFVAAYSILLVFLVIVTLRAARKFLYPMQSRLIGLLLFTLGGTCVQIVFPTVYVTWHCVTLALFLYFLLLSEFDGSLDVLTGLFNRAAFEKAVSRLSGHKKLSVMLIDINDFKRINDTYGHDYGDAALRKIALVIRNSFDGSCCCYRIGGDEFCILCRHADPVRLERQISHITGKLAHERLGDMHLPTLACGYSLFRGEKLLDFQSLLKEADAQMYRAKQQREQALAAEKWA